MGELFRERDVSLITHVDLEHVQFWEEELAGGGYSGWLAENVLKLM